MQAWTSVKVKTVGHPREGQAGTTQGTDKNGRIEVRFDTDLQTEPVKLADLELL